MRAADELLEISVAFVVKLFVYPYFRCVVTVYGRILDRPEEALFGCLWRHLVLADLFEQCNLLVNACISKVLGERLLAQLIDSCQAVPPGLFGAFRRLADDEVYELIHLCRFCARRVVVGGDDPLGHLDDGLVLSIGEELQLVRTRGRFLSSSHAMVNVFGSRIVVGPGGVAQDGQSRNHTRTYGYCFQCIASTHSVFLIGHNPTSEVIRSVSILTNSASQERTHSISV